MLDWKKNHQLNYFKFLEINKCHNLHPQCKLNLIISKKEKYITMINWKASNHHKSYLINIKTSLRTIEIKLNIRYNAADWIVSINFQLHAGKQTIKIRTRTLSGNKTVFSSESSFFLIRVIALGKMISWSLFWKSKAIAKELIVHKYTHLP